MSTDQSTGEAGRDVASRADDQWDEIRNQIVIPGDGTAAATSSRVDLTASDAVAHSTNWARAYGRYLVVGGLICGLAVPELAALARPFLVPLLVASLVLALLQVDFGQVVSYSRRKSLITSLIFTLLILAPVFVALEAKAVLVPYGLPSGIADGMILAALAPPLLAAPVIAFLLGLDSLLALVVSLVAHIAAPLTIAFLTEWLIGPEVTIGVMEMAKRLALLIGAGFGIGMFLRFTGVAKACQKSPSRVAAVDAISVITLALLALALMDGVTALALTDPTFVILAFITGFLLNPLLQLLGASLFIKSGMKTSLTVGLLTGYRNTGVLIAVLAGTTDPKILTFLAIVQIPTFLMPMLTNQLMHWIKRSELIKRETLSESST